MAESRGDLPRRVLTAAVALPVLVVGVLWSPWAFWAVLALAIGGCVWELTTLMLADRGEALVEEHPGMWTHIAGVAAALALMACVMLVPSSPLLLPLVAAIAGLMALVGLSRARQFAAPGRHVGAVLSGLLLVALPLSLLGSLRAEAGAAWIGLAFVTTWLGDMGAYFTGRSLGRHKLAPRISPNKTIEGSVGGLVFASLLAVGLFALVQPEVPAWQVLLVAAPANVLGQLGDLWESSLKRSAGVKDSGRLIPGYGGMFDKFDSMCMAAPWLYGAWVVLGA